MTSRLFGAKPSPVPELTYCHWSSLEQTLVNYFFFFAKYECILSIKCTWKCRLQNGGHFVMVSMCKMINSLWPSGTRSGSTLAQVMAWFLKAPSHYLRQCWFVVNGVLGHSHDQAIAQDILIISIYKISLKNYILKDTATSPICRANEWTYRRPRSPEWFRRSFLYRYFGTSHTLMASWKSATVGFRCHTRGRDADCFLWVLYTTTE